MDKIKLFLYDLFLNRKFFYSIVLEKTLIILFLYVALMESESILKSISNVNNLDKHNIYVNCDSTSNEKIETLYGDENSVIKANELNDYINSNFVNYSYYEYESDFVVNGKKVYQTTTNRYFFDLYNIRVAEGRNFTEEDESNDVGVKPVIVGYGLRKKFKIGKIYEDIDYGTGEKYSFQVIGVLRKETYYPSLTMIGSKNPLDYSFFRLIDKKMLNNFPCIDMTLGSKVIFSDNQDSVKDIEALSDSYQLFDMNFVKLDNTVDYYLEKFVIGMSIVLILLISVIVIMFIMGTNQLILYIKKNNSNFLIKICCGAKQSTIEKTVKVYLIILDLIAFIPTFVYCYFTKGNIVWLFVVGIVSYILNSCVTRITMKKKSIQNINEIVRRG